MVRKKHLRPFPRKRWLQEPKLLTGRGKMTVRGMGEGGIRTWNVSKCFKGLETIHQKYQGGMASA